MDQGQGVHRKAMGHARPGRARRAAIGVVALAAVTSIGIGAATPQLPASAAQVGGTTTVASPTTTTAAGRSQPVTTSTTTVTTDPGSITSTTVTTVTPTTSTPSSTSTSTSTSTTVPPKPTTTTTTTTVPVSPTSTSTSTSTLAPPAPVVPAVAAPRAVTFDSTCSRPATPDLQTYLDSLPAGSTFRSSTTACYLVPYGIRLTRPITVIGGTFFDPTADRSAGTLYNSLKPIILIKDTSHVTVREVSVLGTNTLGDFHARLVGQAGIKVMSSTDVTLTGITAKDTFGDGLELVADFTGHINLPVTGLTVEGYTTINAGRQGITLAEVASSVLNHVNVINPADDGFDFESDIPGVGSNNVTISNCTDEHGFNLIEFFSGPITVTNCTGFHHVTLGSLHSNAPITFVGGTMLCRRRNPVPCIKQDGGSLTFRGVSIDRMLGPGPISELAWSVQGGGSLAFIHSPVQTPFGSVLRPAQVKFTP